MNNYDKNDKQAINAFFEQNKKLISNLRELFVEFIRKYNYRFSNQEDIELEKPYRLPNAKNGEPYEHSFNSNNSDKIIRNLEFTPDKTFGLSFNREEQKLSGKIDLGEAKKKGIDVELRTIFENSNYRSEIYKLHINPKTKDLWENIPSSRNIEFWKADSASEIIRENSATIIAARQRGRSHAHRGTCCDDDFKIIYNSKRNAFIVAVADGAGSCEYSRLGSQLTVNAVCKTIDEIINSEKFDNLTNRESIDKNLTDAISKMFYYASYYDVSYHQEKINDKNNKISNFKQLYSTLLTTLALPLKNNKWLVCSYWIGDGALAIWENNEISLLGNPDGGQYSGETNFLSKEEITTSDNQPNYEKISQRMRIKIADYPLILLMTDGVSDPKFPSNNALHNREYWQKFIEEKEQIDDNTSLSIKELLFKENPEKELENYLNFWSEGEHDDRTLALIIPKQVLEQLKSPKQEITEESLDTTKSESSGDNQENSNENTAQTDLGAISHNETNLDNNDSANSIESNNQSNEGKEIEITLDLDNNSKENKENSDETKNSIDDALETGRNQ